MCTAASLASHSLTLPVFPAHPYAQEVSFEEHRIASLPEGVALEIEPRVGNRKSKTSEEWWALVDGERVAFGARQGSELWWRVLELGDDGR